jgi:hypothetical protein
MSKISGNSTSSILNNSQYNIKKRTSNEQTQDESSLFAINFNDGHSKVTISKEAAILYANYLETPEGMLPVATM